MPKTETETVEEKELSAHAEPERKYGVAELPPDYDANPRIEIRQGYICIGKGQKVRVRESFTEDGTVVYTQTTNNGDRGKDKHSPEVEIPKEMFEAMWPATKGRRTYKTRYLVPIGDLTAELDEYHRDLEGNYSVEVEFPSLLAYDLFEKPDWFGAEVTHDRRYSNSQLSKHGWPEEAPAEEDDDSIDQEPALAA